MMPEVEIQTRQDLAKIYHLLKYFGWDDLMFGHVTARIPGTDTILMNQWGLAFHEITPENLVTVHIDGNIIGPGEINPAGFVIHSAIHRARPEITWIIHTHTNTGIAVGADERGLLPISQISLSVLNNLSYHDYQGIFIEESEQASLIQNLGTTRMMIMRNHGLLALGSSPAEAMFNMYKLQTSCDIQVLCNNNHLKLISPEVVQNHASRTQNIARKVNTGAIWQMFSRLVK